MWRPVPFNGPISCRERTRGIYRLQGVAAGYGACVLLTPDDHKSQYIKRILAKYRPRVLHLEWKRVYDFVEKRSVDGKQTIFSELVKAFLERIRECVFEQDFAGVIGKIAFKKAGIDPKTFLDEMRSGIWTEWGTPSPYKQLDGTGRKLLLYDRERQGITVEVEIKKVVHDQHNKNYPSRNVFATKPRVFRKPIPVDLIRKLAGFEQFSVYPHDLNPFRNITREQYRQLMEKYREFREI